MDIYNIKAKNLTHFFNQYIFVSNNSALKNAGCELYINKFPLKFILSLISKKRQKIFFQLTLEEIYTKSNVLIGFCPKRSSVFSQRINLETFDDANI